MSRIAPVIRFPYYVDLRGPQITIAPCVFNNRMISDEQWEEVFRAGVARRIASKVRDLPVPDFLRHREAV